MNTKTWTLNLRFFIGMVLVITTVSVAAYFSRAYSIRRNAGSLLDRADERATENDYRAAAKYLYQYVELMPDDVDARVQLAEMYDKSAETLGEKNKAVELYYTALALAPNEIDIRCRQSELLVEVGRFDKALEEAQSVLDVESHRSNPKAMMVRAVALHQLALRRTPDVTWQQVVDALVEAITHNSATEEHIELASRLASVYRQKDAQIHGSPIGVPDAEPVLLSQKQREGHANEAMNEMVIANSDRFLAYFARYRYRDEHNLPDADEDLTTALDKNPGENANVSWAAGVHDLRADLLLKARDHFQTVVDESPNEPHGYRGLAHCHVMEASQASSDPGKYQEEMVDAIDTLRKGLKKTGKNDFWLHAQLVDTYLRWNKIKDSGDALDKLVAVLSETTAHLAGDQRTIIHARADLLEARQGLAEAPGIRIGRRADLLEAQQGLDKAAGIKETEEAKSKYEKAKSEYEKEVKSKYEGIVTLLERVLIQEQMSGGTTEGSSDGSDLLQDIRRKAHSLLGETHRALAESHRDLGEAQSDSEEMQLAAEAHEMAADLAPQSLSLRLAAAIAWGAAGNHEKELENHQRGAKPEMMASSDNATQLRLLNFLLGRQLAVPAGNRNWKQLQDLLESAQSTSDSPALKLFGARLAAAQGQKPEAIQLLGEVEDARPQSPSDWRSIVMLYQGLREPKMADQAVARFAQLSTDPVDLALLQAELLAARKQFAEAEKTLTDALTDVLPPLADAQQAILRVRLARLGRQQNNSDAEREHLEKAHKLEPSNMQTVRALCSIALRSSHSEDMKKWEQELRELEGEASTGWRMYKIQRLLIESPEADSDGSQLAEATRLLAEVEETQPNMAATHRLKALIEVKKGNIDGAIAALSELDRSGSFSGSDAARLVQWIYPDEGDANASAAEKELPAILLNSPQGSALAIIRSVARGDIPTAVRDAKAAAATRPNDPAAWVLLGRTLLLAKEHADAEMAFLSATKKSPGSPQVWYELIRFYQETRNFDKAKTALGGLARNTRLSEPQRSLLVAQGHQMIQDRASAQPYLEGLLKSHPTDISVLLQVGKFFAANDPAQAEAVLRKAVEVAPEIPETYRTLALLLARSGTEASFQEACDLLSKNVDSDSPSAVDQRFHAQILLRRNRPEDREKAVLLMVTLVDDPSVATVEDRVTLAGMYETQADIRKATEQLELAVADETKAKTDHVALYASFLIRHMDFAQDEFAQKADEAVKRLAAVKSAKLRVLTLRARWLKQLDRETEIEPLVDEFLKENSPKTADPKTEAALTAQIAGVYDTVDRKDLAEKLLRTAVGKDPQFRWPLALYLANLGSEETTANAVELCVAAAESNETPKAAVSLATVLTLGIPTPDVINKAEPILAAAMQKHTTDLNLLLAVGGYRQMIGQPEEANKLFRRVLELSPANVMALNNLAYLLAFADPAQAAGQIDRAIAIAGGQSWLRDTRGIVYLAQQQPVEAINVFQELAANPKADSRFSFHLALAHQQNGSASEAGKALAQALAAGLKPHMLVPRERKDLTELKAFISSPSTTPDPIQQ